MKVTWRKEHLDVILVPASLFVMFGYHIFLLYRYKRYEHRTVIGHENHCKRVWVERMLKIQAVDRSIAVSVISSNLSAATTLSSICIVLSSLIGAWVGSNSRNIFKSSMIYGDTSESIISLKYVCLLACLIAAFASFFHSARCYVHACFLISMPDVNIPVEIIQKPVIQGSTFWAIGVRALHFAATFLFWVFGPIPMFASSVITAVLLHTLDKTNKPLHQFQPKQSNNLLKKAGQEINAANRVIEPQA
ncbi:hypothetical protein LIER_31137 [Lithospermum erythrorhizon]|uniref:Uncharacterized protein n=1 Tax=Lithospermum erythrorhizon TaxID=34254 RepID=A0AAV3RTM1_LITER